MTESSSLDSDKSTNKRLLIQKKPENESSKSLLNVVSCKPISYEKKRGEVQETSETRDGVE